MPRYPIENLQSSDEEEAWKALRCSVALASVTEPAARSSSALVDPSQLETQIMDEGLDNVDMPLGFRSVSVIGQLGPGTSRSGLCRPSLCGMLGS